MRDAGGEGESNEIGSGSAHQPSSGATKGELSQICVYLPINLLQGLLATKNVFLYGFMGNTMGLCNVNPTLGVLAYAKSA